MSGRQYNDQAGDQSDSADDTRALEREIDRSLRRTDYAVVARARTAVAVVGDHRDRAGAAAGRDSSSRDVPLADDGRMDGGVGSPREHRNRVGGRPGRIAGELDQAERDLASTEEQLRQAQDRITALADEKAQTADEREVARQVAGSVVVVANQLEICVRGQGQLITALEDIASYDPATVSAFAREVSAACSQALDGSKEIKRQLGIE